jgi:hypothetical protein
VTDRKLLKRLEAAIGIEPMNKGFADLCLTTWLRRPNAGIDEKGGKIKEVFSPKLSAAESATENLEPKTTTSLHPSALTSESGAGDET